MTVGLGRYAPLPLICLWVGCNDPRLGIATHEPNPIPSKLANDRCVTIESRYVVIPIVAERSDIDRIYAVGAVSGSAWSGLGFGGFSNECYVLNLEVIRLDTRLNRRVFDRQVAIGSWRMSFAYVGESNCTLRYSDILLLPARTIDANGDGRITQLDPSILYSYKLSTGSLQRISPEGYHLASAQLLSDRIAMVLEKQADRRTTSVYVYYPEKRSGDFVTDSITP